MDESSFLGQPISGHFVLVITMNVLSNPNIESGTEWPDFMILNIADSGHMFIKSGHFWAAALCV